MPRRLLPVLFLTLTGCAITTQQEIALGTDYAEQLDAQLPLVTDPEVNRYLTVLGDSIARVADPRNLDWRFRLVDSPEVNAFAVPGGFVYVNRGLVERTTRLDQLAGVLGHEIGHVVKRHSIRQMQTGQRLNLGMILGCVLTSICTNGGDVVVGMAGQGVMARFSRHDESESDQEAVTYLMRAGIDPRGIPQVFRVLIDERRARPTSGLDAWFRTHPLEEERVRATEARIAKVPPATLERLTRDSPRFQAFRARVLQLPPSATRRPS